MPSDSEEKTTEQPAAAKPAAGKAAGDQAPTAVAASGQTAWQRSPGRRFSVHLMIAVATLLTILAVLANWTRQQLLNTDQWTKSSSELIANPAIRSELATYLVDQLYNNVDVPAAIKTVLPKELQPLAPVAAAGARNLITKGANAALKQPAIQSIWTDANRLAHEQLVTILDGGNATISTQNGDVTIDLGLVLNRIVSSVGLPGTLTNQLPPGAAQVTVVQSKDLQQLQQATQALKTSSVLFSVLAFLLFVGAVALAAGRRAGTLIEAGIGLIIAGVAVVLIRNAGGDAIVNALVTDLTIKPAATAAWNIESTLLSQLATQAIVVGVMLIIAGLLGGPTKAAKAARGWLAPVINRYPEATFAGVGLLILLFLIWAPIPAASRPSFIIIFIILVMLGTYMLRRETLRDFPDVGAPSGDAMRAGTQKIGAAFSRAGAAVKQTTTKAADEVRSMTRSSGDKTTPTGDVESQRIAKLERLVALRDGGALTDSEFAAEKAKILSDNASEQPTQTNG